MMYFFFVICIFAIRNLYFYVFVFFTSNDAFFMRGQFLQGSSEAQHGINQAVIPQWDNMIFEDDWNLEMTS